MWQFGAFSLFVLCFAFWIGDLFNSRTKGIISGLLAASVLYIIGYLSESFLQISLPLWAWEP